MSRDVGHCWDPGHRPGFCRCCASRSWLGFGVDSVGVVVAVVRRRRVRLFGNGLGGGVGVVGSSRTARPLP